jgi:hypothetical protein
VARSVEPGAAAGRDSHVGLVGACDADDPNAVAGDVIDDPPLRVIVDRVDGRRHGVHVLDDAVNLGVGLDQRQHVTNALLVVAIQIPQKVSRRFGQRQPIRRHPASSELQFLV